MAEEQQFLIDYKHFFTDKLLIYPIGYRKWFNLIVKSTKPAQQMVIVDEKIEETFECNICAVKLKTKYYVQKHINLVQNNIKDFECRICDKKFGQKSVILQHIKLVHYKIKHFKCNNCSKKFGLKFHLQRHIKIAHKGLIDFECNICAKQFTESQFFSNI